MHHYLMILSLSTTALLLGIYTALGVIFHMQSFKEPTWSKIRNKAFLGWLLIQCLLYFSSFMGEITLDHFLAPIFTLITTCSYAYAVTHNEKVPALGFIVWLLLALSLGTQTYLVTIANNYIPEKASVNALTIVLNSAFLTIMIQQLKANAQQKAWLAKFDNPQVGTH